MTAQKYHVFSRVKHFVFADTGPSAAYLEPFRFTNLARGSEPGLQFDLICQCDTLDHARLVAGSLNQVDAIQRKVDEDALKTFRIPNCPVCDIAPCVCERIRSFGWPKSISISDRAGEYMAFFPVKCDKCGIAPCCCKTVEDLMLMGVPYPREIETPPFERLKAPSNWIIDPKEPVAAVVSSGPPTEVVIARHAFLCDTCKKAFCTCAPFAMDPVPEKETCKGCDIPFCECWDGRPDPNAPTCKGLDNGCVCDNCVPF